MQTKHQIDMDVERTIELIEGDLKKSQGFICSNNLNDSQKLSLAISYIELALGEIARHKNRLIHKNLKPEIQVEPGIAGVEIDD